MLIFSIK